jgi:hypothetical protein
MWSPGRPHKAGPTSLADLQRPMRLSCSQGSELSDLRTAGMTGRKVWRMQVMAVGNVTRQQQRSTP